MSRNRPPTQEPANNEKNIYIPSFIAAKPFYVGDSESDYLEHQRLKAEPKDTLDKAKWYERGRKLGPAATKYRKGACENCGAMTHKTKECLSRPRKHGAKWTGQDIQADERVDNVKLGWDAKRDRWNGYDAREYDAVVQEYEEMEELRQTAAKSKTPGETQGEDDDDQSANNDSAKYAEETDMGRSQPTSTRQLRLREDTAKYLLNLDLDSAKYDPKTRSMDVDATSLQPTETGEFEGFSRPAETSGDAAAFEHAQKYAWETQEGNIKSNDPNAKKLHLQANPTEGEFLLKKKIIENAERKTAHRKALLDKYGDASVNLSSSNNLASSTSTSTTKSTSKPKTITSSSMYVEYDKYGAPKLPQGQAKPKARSKYAEDVLTNNHTSIWGSYWADFKWGYACCHSFTKNSYCTGDAGRIAFEEAEGLRAGENLLEDGHADADADAEDGAGDSSVERVSRDAAEKLRLEQNSEDIRERKDEGEVDTTRQRSKSKRAFVEMQGGVTEEEMEAYKRNRMAADDPMRQFEGFEDRV